MLIQALAEYADTRLADHDRAFQSHKVRFFLEVGQGGKFLGFIERTEAAERGKKMVTDVQPLNIPYSPVSRNGRNSHPLLGCDDMKYVLGPGPGTSPKDARNHQKRHDAFIALLRKAGAVTGDADVESAVRFYDQPDQVEAARSDLATRKAAPGDMICLHVNGPLVLNPAVRDYWRAHYGSAFGERSKRGGEGMCLISGAFGPIAATHDKIKGAGNIGGKAEVSLMSFDKPAFCSYGWEKNANSPVSPSRAGAYVLALNDLLKAGSTQRRDYGPKKNRLAFVFWTKLAPSDDTYENIERANPAQVNELLHLDPRAVDDPDQFYFLGVSGNGGRLLVRHWYHESLGRVKENVKAWFEGLSIANAFTGGIADPPPLWRLLKAIARDEPPPDRTLQLLQRALEGQPLGRSMLAAALNRLRAATVIKDLKVREEERRLKSPRAGLIRLCINDLTRNEGTTPMNATLDSGQTEPAYLCGRLLAIYDALQYRAHRTDDTQRDLNMTVADRYYSLASTNPMAAFPRVDDLGQKHLRKLRRDKRGVMIAIEREIQEIHQLLADHCGARFPGPLSLIDQGRFAIGFHHQRAESNARIAARKQEKEENQEDKE